MRLGRAQPAGRTLGKSCLSPVRAVSQPTQGLYEGPLAVCREPARGLTGLPAADGGNGEVRGRGYAVPTLPSHTPLCSCAAAARLQDGSCTGLLGLRINTSSSLPATLQHVLSKDRPPAGQGKLSCRQGCPRCRCRGGCSDLPSAVDLHQLPQRQSDAGADRKPLSEQGQGAGQVTLRRDSALGLIPLVFHPGSPAESRAVTPDLG